MKIDSANPKEVYMIRFLTSDNSWKRKYALVVSKEPLNRGHGCLTVLFTTKDLVKRAEFSTCVYFDGTRFGLTDPCVITCEDIGYTLYDDFIEHVGEIDQDHWEQVVEAMGCVFNAACTPDDSGHDF